jgi:hypothetical protein
MAGAGIVLPNLVLSAWMAQDNYEVQVYGADTVEPRTTTVEFHTSFTLDGSKLVAMAL